MLINNVEDIRVFLGFRVLNSEHSNMFPCSKNTFIEKPHFDKSVLKIINVDI